jgi:hypothetical protein
MTWHKLTDDDQERIARAVSDGRHSLGQIIGLLAYCNGKGVQLSSSDIIDPAMELGAALHEIEEVIGRTVEARALESEAAQ